VIPCAARSRVPNGTTSFSKPAIKAVKAHGVIYAISGAGTSFEIAQKSSVGSQKHRGA
jgi:hypothetical protein